MKRSGIGPRAPLPVLCASVLSIALCLLAEDHLPRLVSDLGSDDYATREAATAKLLAVGEPARALLEKARDSRDAEVAMRARRVLDVLDARRDIEVEYKAAVQSFAGEDAENRARRVWLDVLRLAALDQRDALSSHFASGKVPAGFWESARGCPLRWLAKLEWVEVIPGRRLKCMETVVGDDEVVVMAAIPACDVNPEVAPPGFRVEPRALVLQPIGRSWKVARDVGGEILEWAGRVSGSEVGAGARTVQALWSQDRGVIDYNLAQALDAAGDWEAAIRSFSRCQAAAQWPDYCVVHRYFDLMRLGRKEEARRVLDEEPGAGKCEYVGQVIRFLKGEETAESLRAWAADHGSYEAGSAGYYLGMERLLSGDEQAAKELLQKTSAGYEREFALGALELMNSRKEGPATSGDTH